MQEPIAQAQPLQTTNATRATSVINAKNTNNINNVNNQKYVVETRDDGGGGDDDDDVRSGKDQPIRPKTSKPRVRFQAQQSQSNNVQNNAAQEQKYGQKELTPKERMLLNKLKKADEEAARVRCEFF